MGELLFFCLITLSLFTNLVYSSLFIILLCFIIVMAALGIAGNANSRTGCPRTVSGIRPASP
jgi:hypothetical protein